MKKIFILCIFLLSIISMIVPSAYAYAGGQFMIEGEGGGGGSSYTVSVTIFAISDVLNEGSNSNSGSGSVSSWILSWFGINASGHSWLEIKNNYSSSITVGKMSIAPGEAVTLGTWGNKTHIGLYYNLEYYYNSLGDSSYEGRISITETVSISKWNTVNTVINENDEWENDDNCSNFAIDIWNYVCVNDFSYASPYTTPTTLVDQILNLSHLTNDQIDGNSSMIGYYSGSTFVTSTT